MLNSMGHTEDEVIYFINRFKQNAIDKLGYTDFDAYVRAELLYRGLAMQEYMKHSTDLDEKTKAMTRLGQITDELGELNAKYNH